MKCILHIGMPKTGTTSLQVTLGRSRHNLRQKGVLYPRLSSMKHAHHLLMPFFEAPNHCWGRVKQHLGHDEESLLAGARREWEMVRSQIDEHTPDTLLLSTEALFVPMRPRRIKVFRDLILDVASSVSIVAYVRHPSDYYRSILLERAKRLKLPRPLEPISYRRPIEQLETAFSTKARVRSFRRQDLYGEDINTDFFHHELDMVSGDVARDGNRSLSLEAMDVYQHVMEARTGQQVRSARGEQADLLQDLKDIESGIARAKASVFSENTATRSCPQLRRSTSPADDIAKESGRNSGMSRLTSATADQVRCARDAVFMCGWEDEIIRGFYNFLKEPLRPISAPKAATVVPTSTRPAWTRVIGNYVSALRTIWTRTSVHREKCKFRLIQTIFCHSFHSWSRMTSTPVSTIYQGLSDSFSFPSSTCAILHGELNRACSSATASPYLQRNEEF